MSNRLQEICTRRYADVQKQKKQKSWQDLEKDLAKLAPPRDFYQALETRIAKGNIAVIAEIKKASPSAGLIRKDFDVAQLAQSYEKANACCLSVLTEPHFFAGHSQNILQAKQASSLPILRKDFLVDPWQILESAALGADCILLIMAALDITQAKEMAQLAQENKLSVLVEIHNREELEQACTLPDPIIIGVNNRNLKNLTTSLKTSSELAPHIPKSYLRISESGIKSSADITELTQSGYYGFLIGENLMKEPDAGQALTKLLAPSASSPHAHPPNLESFQTTQHDNR